MRALTMERKNIKGLRILPSNGDDDDIDPNIPTFDPRSPTVEVARTPVKISPTSENSITRTPITFTDPRSPNNQDTFDTSGGGPPPAVQPASVGKLARRTPLDFEDPRSPAPITDEPPRTPLSFPDPRSP